MRYCSRISGRTALQPCLLAKGLPMAIFRHQRPPGVKAGVGVFHIVSGPKSSDAVHAVGAFIRPCGTWNTLAPCSRGFTPGYFQAPKGLRGAGRARPDENSRTLRGCAVVSSGAIKWRKYGWYKLPAWNNCDRCLFDAPYFITQHAAIWAGSPRFGSSGGTSVRQRGST